MKEATFEKVDLEVELQPETTLEHLILKDPDFIKGLFWGVPRYGHPEGMVYKHIKEVLKNVDSITTDSVFRQKLRIITFVHDTFKYREDKSHPRDWSKHHGILARQFLEKYHDDQEVLDIIESHDEAYYAWRLQHLYNQKEKGKARLQSLLDRMGDSIQLYYLFFKCDTCTGDKILAPLNWFENTVTQIDVKNFF